MPVVRRSAVIDAPIEVVWDVLRDFNSHGRWHPAIAESAIENFAPPDQVGCVRTFRLRDGGTVREQLLTLSDRDHMLRYCILSTTLPLRDYVAELRLRPVTGADITFCVWEGRFNTTSAREPGLADLVARSIYEAGFEGLRAHLRDAPSHGVPAGGGNFAVVMTAHGGPEVLSWRRWPAGLPGPGEALVRHTAIGVNFIDIYARSGRFALVTPPGVPGLEAAGIVAAVGPGVTAVRPGDRVGYACVPAGAYAMERVIASELLLRLPDGLDDRHAAAGLLKGMTVSFLLHEVHPLRAGETVVIHAAAGGTGTLLAQWAAALGATVIGVVGTAAKQGEALRHGCAHAIVAGDGLLAEVRALTDGRGADAVFDGVGGETFAQSYAMLAERGHLVSYGQAAGPIPAIDIAAFAEKSARVSRPNFSHYTATRAQRDRVAGRFFDALANRMLIIPEPHAMPLRDAAEAHLRIERRLTTGATILLP